MAWRISGTRFGPRARDAAGSRVKRALLAVDGRHLMMERYIRVVASRRAPKSLSHEIPRRALSHLRLASASARVMTVVASGHPQAAI